MSLWFGAAAVAPKIRAEWGLGDWSAGWLTTAVQIGFVAGTLLSALLNLPDVFRPKNLFAICALLAAASNAMLALAASGAASAILLRFLTGFFLAGVYPPGMKVMASWFLRGRGLALGVLVGALTLGKATPYLANATRVLRLAPRAAVLLRRLRGRRAAAAARRRGAVRVSERAVRSAPGGEGLPQPRRPPGELRLLRTHVGAVRDVDLDPRHAAQQPGAHRGAGAPRRARQFSRHRKRRGRLRRRQGSRRTASVERSSPPRPW